MVPIATFCTASILDQFILLISEPHAGEAYNRIGLMYMLKMESLVDIGIGDLLLSMGYNGALVCLAFWMDLVTCLFNLKALPKVTPRYVVLFFHSIFLFYIWIFREGCLRLVPRSIDNVFCVFSFFRHLDIQSVVVVT